MEREHGYAMWAVDVKEIGTFVGQCGLQPVERAGPEVELAYHFNKASWNKGYATEAAIAVLAHGLGLVGLERVIAVVVPENVGSWRVMEKAGMRYEGLATYYDMPGLKKYAAERDWWRLPTPSAEDRAVREVRTGVWHWEARHPEWNERQWWGPLVSSYAIDDGVRLVLFDPLAPPPEIEKLAEERETAIVLTCPWHRREAEALAKRYGATLYVPPPDAGDPSPVSGTVYRAGDRLPVDVEALPGMEPNDLVLWVESQRALVAGDTLQDRGDGLQFLGDLVNNVPEGFSVEEIREGLRPLLALPVELVLQTHGGPADKAALERALS